MLEHGIMVCYFRGGGGLQVGAGVQGNLWYNPPTDAIRDVILATFKMASKVFIEETDNNFNLTTDILFRFLGFGDVMVFIIIEN